MEGTPGHPRQGTQSSRTQSPSLKVLDDQPLPAQPPTLSARLGSKWTPQLNTGATETQDNVGRSACRAELGNLITQLGANASLQQHLPLNDSHIKFANS